MPSIETEIVNEYTLKLHFDSSTIFESADKVAAISHYLTHDNAQQEIIDLIPAYNTLAIVLDIHLSTSLEFKNKLPALLGDTQSAQRKSPSQIHDLPCYYGSEVAWDLDELAREKNLDPELVVQQHAYQTYRVFALGFSPGFPYLGFVAKEIATARKKQPRVSVPRGAVGIAENQTGIYPQSSPGGWNIIGCCPLELFSFGSNTDSLSRLKPGDSVVFKPISRDEFIALGGNLEHAESGRCK